MAVRIAVALFAAAAASSVTPRTAHANGAFPDSRGILTPTARPQEISLVTNFGKLYRSHDGGVSFEPVTTPVPHIRGLSARGGAIYAAANNSGDGYALGVSTDDGTTISAVSSSRVGGVSSLQIGRRRRANQAGARDEYQRAR